MIPVYVYPLIIIGLAIVAIGTVASIALWQAFAQNHQNKNSPDSFYELNARQTAMAADHAIGRKVLRFVKSVCIATGLSDVDSQIYQLFYQTFQVTRNCSESVSMFASANPDLCDKIIHAVNPYDAAFEAMDHAGDLFPASYSRLPPELKYMMSLDFAAAPPVAPVKQWPPLAAELLPNDSAFIGTQHPLPPDHWLYDTKRHTFEPLALISSSARFHLEARVREALRRYTESGNDMTIDPDALVLTLSVLLCGPITRTTRDDLNE